MKAGDEEGEGFGAANFGERGARRNFPIFLLFLSVVVVGGDDDFRACEENEQEIWRGEEEPYGEFPPIVVLLLSSNRLSIFCCGKSESFPSSRFSA